MSDEHVIIAGERVYDPRLDRLEAQVSLARMAYEAALAEASPEPPPADDWAIVEIMGHRRHAGRVRDEERFGARMLRVDVPEIPADGGATTWTTHWYTAAAIFSVTACDEATVRRINRPYDPPGRYLAGPARDDIDADEGSDD